MKMKHLLLTTIAAVLMVGCAGVSKTELFKDEEGNLIILPVEPVPEAATPEPPTAKVPDISIHIAAMQGNLEAVKQHIAAGADVNAKDVNGYTPLDWAIFNKDTETTNLLRKHGGKTGEELKAEGK
jgi:ankyrin repeat protein